MFTAAIRAPNKVNAASLKGRMSVLAGTVLSRRGGDEGFELSTLPKGLAPPGPPSVQIPGTAARANLQSPAQARRPPCRGLCNAATCPCPREEDGSSSVGRSGHTSSRPGGTARTSISAAGLFVQLKKIPTNETRIHKPSTGAKIHLAS